MQNKNYIYLYDNKLQFYSLKYDKFYNFSFSKKVLENGKVINRPKFIREFTLFLKQNHIIKKFQKNILYFIIPPNFHEIDKEILKKIFEDLPFHEIKITKETNHYKVKKNSMWVNLNQNYLFLTSLIKHKKETIVLNNNYLNYNFVNQLTLFLKNNKNIKKVYLFGSNLEIPLISSVLEEETNKIILYFEDYQNYILKEVIRHNNS